jgi:hypothetical protein
MSTRNLLLWSAYVLLLAPAFVGAQDSRDAQKPNPSETKVGLLVAFTMGKTVSTGEGAPPPSKYETWWVVRDNTGARVITKLPDVIVPRKDGFWRIGIQTTCQFRSPEKDSPDDHGEIVTEEILYGVPFDQRPVLQLEDPACDEKTQERVFDPAYDPNANSSDKNAPNECRWGKKSLISVLPDLISIDSVEGVRESCDPHEREEYSSYVQNPDEIRRVGGAHLLLSQVFGEKGIAAWSRTIQANFGKDSSCPGMPPPEEGGWYLRHLGGGWHALAQAQLGAYKADCAVDGDMGISVPRSLTHSAPLLVSWRDLQKQIPNLADAYLSPDGSVLLAIQSTSVRLVDFTGNKPGATLLELSSNALVMAEWSTGTYVDKWTATLSAAEKQGLPKPTVVVRDSH